MNPRSYWQDYVTRSGGLTAAAAKLGIPYATLAAVSNGRRGIGRRLAQQMASVDPTLDASVLVWVRPTETFANPRSADADTGGKAIA